MNKISAPSSKQQGGVTRRRPFLHVCALATLFALVVLNCGGGKELPAGAVARVNNQLITNAEFEKRFAAARQGALENPPDELASQLAIRAAFLDQLVERVLLEQVAARLKIVVSEPEVDRILLGMREGHEVADLIGYLTTHQLDDLVLRDRIRYALLVDKMASRYAAAKLAVSEQEVRDYYAANPAEFALPPRIRLRQIVVDNEDFAFQTMNDIMLGESFESAARTRSSSPERARGGDLGFVSRDMLIPEVAEAAFALRVGELSNVVRSPYGFHLLQVTATKPAETLTFEQAQATIHDKLRRQKADRLWQDFVAKLKSRAEIQIDRSRLLGPS